MSVLWWGSVGVVVKYCRCCGGVVSVLWWGSCRIIWPRIRNLKRSVMKVRQLYVCARGRACVWACMCVGVHVCGRACVCACMCVHVCVCACGCVCGIRVSI